MIAKGKSLTLYEPGHQIPKPHRVQLEQVYSAIESVPGYRCDMSGTTSSPPDARIVAARWRPAAYGDSQIGFRLAATNKDGIPGPPTEVPPDTGSRLMILGLRVRVNVVRPIEQFIAGAQSTATICIQEMMLPSCNPATIRAPLDRAWRDVKGVTISST
jgi:hypothetical protein